MLPGESVTQLLPADGKSILTYCSASEFEQGWLSRPSRPSCKSRKMPSRAETLDALNKIESLRIGWDKRPNFIGCGCSIPVIE